MGRGSEKCQKVSHVILMAPKISKRDKVIFKPFCSMHNSSLETLISLVSNPFSTVVTFDQRREAFDSKILASLQPVKSIPSTF